MSAAGLSSADLEIVAQINEHMARRAPSGDPSAPQAGLNAQPDPDDSQLDPGVAGPPEGALPDPAAASSADGEGDPEGSPDDEKAAAPEDVISTIEALAETLGAEPDVVLESIQVENAVGIPVSLGEALEGWRQSEQTFEARRAELETNYENRTRETVTRADAAARNLAAIANVLIDEMAAEFKGVDLEQLKLTNPEEFVRLSEMRMRRKELLSRAVQGVQQFKAMTDDLDGERLQKSRREEAVKLAKARPDWLKNPELMRKIVDENHWVMRQFGYSEQEIDGVLDHRHILVLNAAAQHLKTLAAAKGKAVPKTGRRQLLRPTAFQGGARSATPPPEVQGHQDRLAAFQKRRDVDSAAAVIQGIMTAHKR